MFISGGLAGVFTSYALENMHFAEFTPFSDYEILGDEEGSIPHQISNNSNPIYSIPIQNSWRHRLHTGVDIKIEPPDTYVNISHTCDKDCSDTKSWIIDGNDKGFLSINLSLYNASFDKYEICIRVWEIGHKQNNDTECYSVLISNPFVKEVLDNEIQ